MNELTLCIVNEGADYQERLERARQTRRMSNYARYARWTDRVRQEARKLNKEFGRPIDESEISEACRELDAYYQQHLAEM